MRTMPVRSETSELALAVKRATPGPDDDGLEIKVMNEEAETADHAQLAGSLPVILTDTSKAPLFCDGRRTLVGDTV